MRLLLKELRQLISEEINNSFLFEEEEEDTGGDEEGGDEEAVDEEGGDTGGGGGGSVGGAGGGGGADAGMDELTAEEEAEKPDITNYDEISLNKSTDDQIQAMFIDFEATAIKSATVQSEYFIRKPLSIIFEEVTEDIDPEKFHNIDINSFAANVARLVLNYDSLLDIESLIINKAMIFLTDKYDEETAQDFEDIMADTHSISLDRDYQQPEAPEAPLAIGTMPSAGA